MRRGSDERYWGLLWRCRVFGSIFKDDGKRLEMCGRFRGGEIRPLHVMTHGRRQKPSRQKSLVFFVDCLECIHLKVDGDVTYKRLNSFMILHDFKCNHDS